MPRPLQAWTPRGRGQTSLQPTLIPAACDSLQLGCTYAGPPPAPRSLRLKVARPGPVARRATEYSVTDSSGAPVDGGQTSGGPDHGESDFSKALGITLSRVESPPAGLTGRRLWQPEPRSLPGWPARGSLAHGTVDSPEFSAGLETWQRHSHRPSAWSRTRTVTAAPSIKPNGQVTVDSDSGRRLDGPPGRASVAPHVGRGPWPRVGSGTRADAYGGSFILEV